MNQEALDWRAEAGEMVAFAGGVRVGTVVQINERRWQWSHGEPLYIGVCLSEAEGMTRVEDWWSEVS